MKNFFNAHGVVYARISDDGVLRKSERQSDRLRITGLREHAIDEVLLRECLALDVKTVEIKEKGDGGCVRLWRIDIMDVEKYGKKVTLRGVQRRTIPLLRCQLVSGPAEPWYTAEREAMKRAEAPKTPTATQACLFDATELQSVAQFGRWL